MYRFIHAADIHLDSPLKGLARYEGAPVEEIREASRRALKNLVRLAMDEEARFVVLSGDVFDGDWRDYNTGLFFISQMSKLGQAGVQVFLAAGNHDFLSPISRTLRMPGNVHVFSTRSFESKRLDTIGAVIHGRGFPGRVVDESWVPSFPEPVKDAFNIGILHTSLAGYAGHDTYAPCTLGALQNKGYGYWALGHVHRHEILSTSPHVVFPGNIQGRHIRETGAKGCMLVSVRDNEVLDACFHELDVLRWHHLSIGTDSAGPDDVMAELAERMSGIIHGSGGRIAAVRLTVRGGRKADAAFRKDPEKWRSELKAAAIEAGRGEVWLEKILFESGGLSGHVPDGLLRELLETLREEGGDEAPLPEAGIASLKRLFDKLPPELTTGEDAWSLDDVPRLRQAAQEGMEQLAATMTGSPEER